MHSSQSHELSMYQYYHSIFMTTLLGHAVVSISQLKKQLWQGDLTLVQEVNSQTWGQSLVLLSHCHYRASWDGHCTLPGFSLGHGVI